MGNIYWKQDKFKNAITEYRIALNLAKKQQGFMANEYLLHNNIGQVMLEKGDPKPAIEQFKHALDICSKSGSKMDEGFIQLNLSIGYLELNNISTSSEWLKIGMKNVIAVGYPHDMVEGYRVKAMFHRKKKAYYKALTALRKAIKISRADKLHNLVGNFYKEMSNIYKDMGDLKKALKFLDKYATDLTISENEKFETILQEKQRSLSRVNDEFNILRTKEENKRLKLEVSHKNRELTSKALFSASNRSFVEDLKSQVKNGFNMTQLIKLCDNKITETQDWQDFEIRFNDVHPDFIKRLESQSSKLSPMEIRVCTLIRMGYDTLEIAGLLWISKRGTEQHRYRISKKLKINENLFTYISTL